MIQTHEIAMNTPAHNPILLIEDDKSIANLVSLHIGDSYALSVEHDGLVGFTRAKEESWSLILLDLRLPSKDGLEICRDLRAHSVDTPLLMLTSRSSELDRVVGLEMGADDYLVKPFSMLELEARIKALLRRVKMDSETKTEKGILSLGQLKLNQRTREAYKDDDALELTSKEFDLLAFFMSQPGTVFSRTDLLNNVWGYAHSGYEHTVNSHINRLRAKLEVNPAEPELLVTVWGVGYKIHATH